MNEENSPASPVEEALKACDHLPWGQPWRRHARVLAVEVKYLRGDFDFPKGTYADYLMAMRDAAR